MGAMLVPITVATMPWVPTLPDAGVNTTRAIPPASVVADTAVIGVPDGLNATPPLDPDATLN